jgi:hypothetical protein
MAEEVPVPVPETQTTATTQVTHGVPTSVDGVMWMLYVGILFYTLLMMATYKVFEQDMMVFAIMSNVLSNFTGAFFMHIKSK